MAMTSSGGQPSEMATSPMATNPDPDPAIADHATSDHMTADHATADHMTADREIVISRDISAPRELVFEAFTQVRHLSRWWGPEGFTTSTRSFEFSAGGDWDFVMHGPDGTDYQEWITWTEIVPPERIALVHGESRDDPNAFESLLTFEPAGAMTRIVMRTVFPTKEFRDEVVEKYHAIEGGEQTLGHLADYVAELIRDGVTSK
jgi:uncharacterized protein YndB with AHSA1/START domain